MKVACTLLAAIAMSGCSQAEQSPPSAVAHRDRILVANHSLKAFGGRLLGTDHGEWGGELFFEDSGGTLTKILSENVQGIVSYHGRTLVFTGLNHMGVSRGDLYEVTRPSSGAPHLQHLGFLPGTPTSVVSHADGSVSFLLSNAGGGVQDCYEVAEPGIKHSNKCDPPQPLGSNKSFKPNPLRGSA